MSPPPPPLHLYVSSYVTSTSGQPSAPLLLLSSLVPDIVKELYFYSIALLYIAKKSAHIAHLID